MTPVRSLLQQHLAAAEATPPGSPDEAEFRQAVLPQLHSLLGALQQLPEELLKAVEDQQQQDEDKEEGGKEKVQQGQRQPHNSSSKPGGGAATAAAFEPLKQLQQQLAQQLRQQHHLELARVAPLLSSLRGTAIPLPADDLTATTLPPLPLRATMDNDGATSSSSSSSQVASGAELAAAADVGPAASSGSWLCIASFDQTVLVLPTKTRPKRLRLLANDGSVHAFLLKGRDDLRVDERLMQFMRTANALLAAPHNASCYASSSDNNVASEAAAAAAGALRPVIGRKQQEQQLRVRPYSITPLGRRAGLVQWVRHTTSLFGLVRAWQAATAERHHAVAAAKREAAAAAVAAAAGSGAAAAEAAAAADGTDDAKADSSSSGVVLPLLVAAMRPADAFYARLLPALQAAGVSVGAPRSSWPAGECFCTRCGCKS
jgi:PI-3-kinase-related kinase SMG-1